MIYNDIREFCLDVFNIYSAFYEDKMYMYTKSVYDNQHIKYTTPSKNNSSSITVLSIEPIITIMSLESQIDYTPLYLYLRFDNTDEQVTITQEFVDRTIYLNDYPNLLLEENYFQQSLIMDKITFDVVYMYQYFRSKKMHSFYFDLDYYDETKQCLNRL